LKRRYCYKYFTYYIIPILNTNKNIIIILSLIIGTVPLENKTVFLKYSAENRGLYNSRQSRYPSQILNTSINIVVKYILALFIRAQGRITRFYCSSYRSIAFICQVEKRDFPGVCRSSPEECFRKLLIAFLFYIIRYHVRRSCIFASYWIIILYSY